ncbi:type IV fimbrial assembly protein PilC [Halalkalibacter wakoensis JCM 9140]|uniref:Type IV fimbrial assembly protein PilC n=1 Tax=Halalkalibacter wakoensis JCM 9140 TaxID=1236970 RepID=W4Q6L6_9BACI|nr:type II secretion system F family protein [Halalkalibacter wakoensis]GAE27338.1 type IV fimbrial assembly protein PilC [Halalkalibacter wakoensis JCM 9140]
MAQYKYIGRDVTGRIKKGTIVGQSKREAAAKLKERRIAVQELEETKATGLNKEITFGNPVRLQDFSVFLRQFSTLLKAGVSIVESTQILSKQTSSKHLRKTLESIEDELRSGVPFSEAAAKYKKVFPPIVINMIKAGELSGTMDEALDRLAIYYEKQHKTRQKVISALAYPVIVGIVAVAVVIFLLVSVVPTFANMLTDLGGELPGITVFVMNASEFVQGFWWLLILFVIALIIGLQVLKQNPDTRYYLDYSLLRMPIFGKLFQLAALARLTRTLSSLFSSSVPILQAVGIVEKVVGNEVIAKILRTSRQSLEKGESLTAPMRSSWVFPPLVIQMITIGEETGSLDLMLSKVADFYEDEVENMTDRLKSLIEPLMIVFLAAIVGVIVIAIMVPMFQIYSEI